MFIRLGFRNFLLGLILISMLSVGFPVLHAIAQVPSNLQFIEKYLDSKTMFIGWADPTKINENELKTIVNQFDGEALEAIKSWLSSLREAGAKKVFVLAESPFYIQGQAVVVVETNTPDKIVEWVKTQTNQGLTTPGAVNHVPKLAIRTLGDSVVIGLTEQVVSSIIDKNGQPSQNMKTAIESCKGTNGIVIAFPHDMNAMTLSLAIPTAEIVDPNGKLLFEAAKSLQYAGIHGELPLPVAGTIKLGSSKDAQQFATAAESLLTTYAPRGFKLPNMVVQDQTIKLSLKSSGEFDTSFGSLVADARNKAREAVSMNNMRQIMLAMHIFHEVHGNLPPQALVSKDGKKLLSWRVLILPYIEQKPLYDKFHLDEPWDSEHNKQLIAQMPAIYSSSNKGEKKETTRYVAPLTAKSIFGRKGAAAKFSDITDGTSITISIIETSPVKEVIWTKPEDIVVDSNNVIKSLFDAKQEQWTAGFADGSVRRFDSSTKPEEFLEMIDIETPGQP